uniref:Uncharacterized protein n=1 Tax=Arundo donax TaxID=35708 RepID=A0A0A9BGC5_ARUDO
MASGRRKTGRRGRTASGGAQRMLVVAERQRKRQMSAEKTREWRGEL